MTKPERITELKKSGYLPLIVFIFLSIVTALMVKVNSSGLKRDQFAVTEQLADQGHSRNIGTPESGRAFYSLIEHLASRGIVRCDMLLPDKNCGEIQKTPIQQYLSEKYFYYNRETNHLKRDSVLPSHLARAILIHTGSPEGRYSMVVNLQGDNSKIVIENFLSILERASSCKMIRSWILVETPLITERLTQNNSFAVVYENNTLGIYANDGQKSENLKKIKDAIDNFSSTNAVSSLNFQTSSCF